MKLSRDAVLKYLVALGAGSLAVLFTSLRAAAADEVVPPMITFTNVRAEAEAFVDAVNYFEGLSLRLTNCVSLTSTTNGSPTQQLSGVTIQVRVGRPETSVLYTATSQTTNPGVWSANVTIPANLAVNNEINLQVKMIDSNTNTYIYPWKKIHTKKSL